MYSLVPTPTFKRDLKRLSKKHWPMDELKTAVNLLAAGTNAELLSKKYADHALSSSSEWKGYRELYVDGPRGDWLLIYKIEQQDLILTLVRKPDLIITFWLNRITKGRPKRAAFVLWSTSRFIRQYTRDFTTIFNQRLEIANSSAQ